MQKSQGSWQSGVCWVETDLGVKCWQWACMAGVDVCDFPVGRSGSGNRGWFGCGGFGVEVGK